MHLDIIALYVDKNSSRSKHPIKIIIQVEICNFPTRIPLENTSAQVTYCFFSSHLSVLNVPFARIVTHTLLQSHIHFPPKNLYTPFFSYARTITRYISRRAAVVLHYTAVRIAFLLLFPSLNSGNLPPVLRNVAVRRYPFSTEDRWLYIYSELGEIILHSYRFRYARNAEIGELISSFRLCVMHSTWWGIPGCISAWSGVLSGTAPV